ncbi:trypco2 family protein [Streptomyces sp. NPDC058695]|uniref:trypco2 family protein n=1 Tax=Streptomyces sp. NPDC058695 TaxID=3346604 RepID=UPI0036484740
MAELRDELYQAQEDGSDEQFRFEVESAELELTVEFRKGGDGKVKVSVGAAGVEAGGTVASTTSHRLALKLNIRDGALGGTGAVIGRNAPEAAPAPGTFDAPGHRQRVRATPGRKYLRRL